MKANKWVAVLATGLVLAVAAPVSAQFGGLKSLKKAMDTVAKELEKPKPAPQPQPTARPTPPQSNLPTEQGGYASPAPARTPQVTAPSAPVVRQAVTNEVVATEAWRCLEDGLSSNLTLEYFRDNAGKRIGNFTEISEDEGKQNIEKGRFRSDGVNYKLQYENSDLGNQSLSINFLSSEDGYVSPKIRYESDEMKDVSTLILEMPENSSDEYEENGGGSNGKMCDIVKPIYSKYSFEDFYVDKPSGRFERYSEDPKQPQFSGRDIKFRNIRTMLLEAVNNSYSDPKFGKYFILASGGKHMARYAYLVDMRSGEVHELFIDTIEDGAVLDYLINDLY